VVYYNEIDEYAAAWLSRLMDAGVIAQGAIDTRSIEDVTPDDLKGFTQCHFFAGIGGWSYALRLAGWPDTRPVWTGSCPCQPFSAAGKGLGFADERHLWPSWFWLIQQCRPRVIFGEQVDKATAWLDLVATDLEGEDYACGPIVLPAAGIGAPHGRHRIWYVAESDSAKFQTRVVQRVGDETRPECAPQSGLPGVLALPGRTECGSADRGRAHVELAGSSDVGSVGDVLCERRAGESFRLVGASHQGPATFWSDADWIYCRDGKYRSVEPGTFPLAHGVSNRVGRLRAYGNAIVPQEAAEVIQAYCEVRGL
jgi:DNA (cytosine-5)-methyltransferase 1